MSNLTITNFEGALVVDSRLIADELGIQHKNFIQTINKYLTEIQEFGQLTFATATVTNSVGARNTVRFCHLNEDQATYVMTLSKNTDAVRQCKRNLVKAFSKAKEVIKTIIPQQSDRIQELELQLKIAEAQRDTIKEQRQLLGKSEAIVQMHGPQMLALIQGRPDAVVEKVEKVTETIVCKNGRTVSFEGRSTAEVGKELGFKTGKEFERYLEKIGRSDLICQGLKINQAPYIPTENLKDVKEIFSTNKNRQLLIGE